MARSNKRETNLITQWRSLSSGESVTDKIDSVGEALGVTELNYTFSSLLKSEKKEIEAKMSESPKAEHQKGTDLRLQATDLQREIKKRKKGEKGNKKTCSPQIFSSPITKTSHVLLALSVVVMNKAWRLQRSEDHTQLHIAKYIHICVLTQWVCYQRRRIFDSKGGCLY